MRDVQYCLNDKNKLRAYQTKKSGTHILKYMRCPICKEVHVYERLDGELKLAYTYPYRKKHTFGGVEV